MKKIIAPVLVLAALALAACSKGGSAASSPASPDASKAAAPAKLRIALILPGSMNDGGWNAAAYRGLMDLKDEGYEVAFTENVEISSIEETLHNYAANNFDLVIGHGFECGEPVMRVSESYPGVRFFVSGKMPDGVGEADIPANVGFMDMKEYEAAYLAGMVAGGMTKSNIIGYVAGMEIPSQVSDMAAFVKGVAATNPKAKVYGVVTGTFEDPATGKEAALAQIDLGADIIAQSADSTGIGVFEAVAERQGVNLIGYGADQYEMQPDRVITCFITDNPSAIKLQAKRIEEGSFGGLWSPGIADGICFISPYHNFESRIPQSLKEQVETAIKDISSGKLVVPAIYERIDEKLK
ncbi:MAG: BMP family protein [Treponema sp.]|nr:BMP family protein [Treponema sp.]